MTDKHWKTQGLVYFVLILSRRKKELVMN